MTPYQFKRHLREEITRLEKRIEVLEKQVKILEKNLGTNKVVPLKGNLSPAISPHHCPRCGHMKASCQCDRT